jgi:plastocyanin
MHSVLAVSNRLGRDAMVATVLTCLLAALNAAPALADADVQTVEPSATDIMTWAFDPVQVTIQAGESVTWINNGAQSHTATASNGAFDTGLIPPGESKTVALAAPGSYEFNCTPHPWMKGTINVIAAAAAPAAQPTVPPAAAPTAVPKPAAAPAVAKPAVQPAPTPTPFRLGTTTPTPAPRAGSLPIELALPLLLGGASVAGAGIYLLRRR